MRFKKLKFLNVLKYYVEFIQNYKTSHPSINKKNIINLCKHCINFLNLYSLYVTSNKLSLLQVFMNFYHL